MYGGMGAYPGAYAQAGFPGAYATAGFGGSWFGVGAVVIGVLILIAICCVFCAFV